MNMLTKIAMAIHAPHLPAEYREMEWLRSCHAEQERAILRAHAVLRTIESQWQAMIDAADEE
jgi:hypothetical protein